MKLINGRLGQYYWHRYCRLLIPCDPFFRIGKEFLPVEMSLDVEERRQLIRERIELSGKIKELGTNPRSESGDFILWYGAANNYAHNPIFSTAERRSYQNKRVQINHPWYKLWQVGLQDALILEYPTRLKFRNRWQYQFYGGFGLRFRNSVWIEEYRSAYDIRFVQRLFFWWSERQAEAQIAVRKGFFRAAHFYRWASRRARLIGTATEPLGSYTSGSGVFSRSYGYRHTLYQGPEAFFVDPLRFDWQKNAYYQICNLYVLCRAMPLLRPLFTRQRVNFAWFAAQDPTDCFTR
jgi:hypothetical protein